jgi:hypothetical protein
MYDRIETPGGGIILFQGMVMRIEAVRGLFPRSASTRARPEIGRDALGYYHERNDEHRTSA